MPSPAPIALGSTRLETFLVVAQSAQVSAPAWLLNLSQPAVTAQVRPLEAAVRQPLLLRHTKGMQLTKRGRRLLDYAPAPPPRPTLFPSCCRLSFAAIPLRRSPWKRGIRTKSWTGSGKAGSPWDLWKG